MELSHGKEQGTNVLNLPRIVTPSTMLLLISVTAQYGNRGSDCMVDSSILPVKLINYSDMQQILALFDCVVMPEAR